MNVNRLRGLMEAHDDMSQAELARRLGATQGSIQQILAGTTKRSRLLPDIAREFGVSVEYLLGATDDPRSTRQALLEGGPVELIADERVVAIQKMDFTHGRPARYYGEFQKGDDVELAYFDKGFLQAFTRAPSTKLFLATGLGDTMAPTLTDRDSIIIDETRRHIDDQDRIWAIIYGSVHMIRRIRRTTTNRVMVISESTSVPDFEADDSEVIIVGRVVWMGRGL